MTYTREQILSMPTGRELDILAAEKVFGLQVSWTQDEYADLCPIDERGFYIDFFSTDFTDAWELAQKFETIEIKRFVTDKGLWFCEINKDCNWHRAYGETAPEAITKAAILAMMEQSGGTGE